MVEGLFNSNSSREEMIIIIIYGTNSSGKRRSFSQIKHKKSKNTDELCSS